MRPARIAIVGSGPRGLGALEALAVQLYAAPDVAMKVDLFDPFPQPGAGPNFAPGESPLCLLNIPHRDIAIRPPDGSRHGSFGDWLGGDPDDDSFPPRADLGRYLTARFEEVTAGGVPPVVRRCETVEQITRCESGWQLKVDGVWRAPYDEVLLTLGQPAVEPDGQWAGWQGHAAKTQAEMAEAYPAYRLEQQAAAWAGQTVAIRGLGLSAFDVLRALTLAQGGAMRDGCYHPSGDEPGRILPFSLDGKPPFPKPETAEEDARYDPRSEETECFKAAMARAAESDPDIAQKLINAALEPVACRILAPYGKNCEVEEWLATEWRAPATQNSDGPEATLRQGIDLASGRVPPATGYVIGQIWRKWQDEIRSGFNPAAVPVATAKRIVAFDEGLKRYSYGPPIGSCRELVAFIESGLVDLSCAADPDITLTEKGWRLAAGKASANVSVMIDAVLPSPDLGAITGPLVPDLLEQGHLTVLSPDLAARTAPDGRLIGADGQPRDGLCLLGRLALGSVIAVDSLHDCFGAASTRWAQGAMARMR